MPSRRRCLVGLAAAAGAALGPRARAAADGVLVAADVHANGYPTVRAAQFIGERLARETGGRLSMRVYHSGQLGREADTIDLARFGAIDLARVHVGAINNVFPATRVLVLPFVFDSTAHLRRAIDGAPGRRVREAFERRGLVGLAIYDSGVRSFYNTRHPVVVPGDLHGLKVRVPPSDLFLDLARTLGASPTPLAYGEVYSALQTHLIDGAENNVVSFQSSRQFEVARYWSETRHSYAPDVLVMSKARFDALLPGDRERLLAAAADSVPYMRALWDTAVAAARDAVARAGVAINEVDQPAFRAAAAPFLRRALADPETAALHAAIRASA